MLTATQCNEKAKLNAMARVIENQTLTGLDTLINEVVASGLFLVGERNEFGVAEFDLAEDIHRVRARLFLELQAVIGAIADWEPTKERTPDSIPWRMMTGEWVRLAGQVPPPAEPA